MKFEEIKKLKTPQKKYSKKELKKTNSSLNIKSIRRYNNLSVILMYPKTKGSLRNLSLLVNDGNKSCSWTSRITFYKNEWIISIAPYSELDKKNIAINVFEEMDKEFKNIDNIYINGSLHVVFLKTNKKKDVEKIINHAISVFSDNEIQGIRNFPINQKYNIQNTENNYKLIYDYAPIKDNKLIIKNKTLLSSIKKQNVSDKDIALLSTVEEKINNNDIISNTELDIINELSVKYCSNKERLQIAIKFMS